MSAHLSGNAVFGKLRFDVALRVLTMDRAVGFPAISDSLVESPGVAGCLAHSAHTWFSWVLLLWMLCRIIKDVVDIFRCLGDLRGWVGWLTSWSSPQPGEPVAAAAEPLAGAPLPFSIMVTKNVASSKDPVFHFTTDCGSMCNSCVTCRPCDKKACVAAYNKKTL